MPSHAWLCPLQVHVCGEEMDRLAAAKAAAQAEAEEADAAAQQALETGHAEVGGRGGVGCACQWVQQ
jgi:hypothetical protein